MAGSSFGNIFRITTWGESHGKAIGVVIDGIPSGLPLNEDDLALFLNRRRPGSNAYGTKRNEADAPEILSGIFEGKTKSVPVRPEILFALSSQVVNHANEHHSDEEIRNLIYYTAKMPAEFRNRIFTDLLHIKSLRKKLSRISVYDDWFLRTGKDWEDYGVT